MNKFIPLLLVAFLWLTTGCASSPSPTPVPIASPTYPIPADDAYVATECMPVAVARPADSTSSGIAVLGDYRSFLHPILVNLRDGYRTQVSSPDESISKVVVSPDRKTMAYVLSRNGTAWNLVISDALGNRLKIIPWPQGYFDLGEWLNNQQMLLLTTPPFLVFNPDTGEQKGFDYTDLPGYQQDNAANRFVAFDPTFHLALYKSSDGNISLEDLDTRSILGWVANPTAPTPTAAWSPDGSQVAVVGNATPKDGSNQAGDEIYSLTRDGQVKKLTHLADHYGPNVTIFPSSLSWSPDGRYIAFWLVYSFPQWELAVFDTVSQKTTNYCISNLVTSQLIYKPLSAPAWSPDGTQIMVENRYNPTGAHLVILDLSVKKAYRVGEDLYPFGWMLSSSP